MKPVLVPEGPQYQLKYRVFEGDREMGVVSKGHIQYLSPTGTGWTSRLVWFVEGKSQSFVTRREAVAWLVQNPTTGSSDQRLRGRHDV